MVDIEKNDGLAPQSSYTEQKDPQHVAAPGTDELARIQAANAKLANPLSGKSDDDLRADAEEFCESITGTHSIHKHAHEQAVHQAAKTT